MRVDFLRLNSWKSAAFGTFVIVSIAIFSQPALAASQFDFTRYCDPEKMKVALQTILPRGTDKTVAEEKLVKEGGATIQPDDRPRSNPNIIHYNRDVSCNPENSQWTVTVVYDKHQAIWQIEATDTGPIFPKVIPSDRTDPGIFNLSDYNGSDDLLLTLRALFPEGTPREQVEKVLVHWNLARVLTEGGRLSDRLLSI